MKFSNRLLPAMVNFQSIWLFSDRNDVISMPSSKLLIRLLVTSYIKHRWIKSSSWLLSTEFGLGTRQRVVLSKYTIYWKNIWSYFTDAHWHDECFIWLQKYPHFTVFNERLKVMFCILTMILLTYPTNLLIILVLAW